MASLTATNADPTAPHPNAPRTGARVALVVALVAAAVWFAWRVVTVGPHPLRIVVLLVELSAWTGGVLVARGLLAAGAPRGSLDTDVTYRYAFAVADRVGRTRADDLRLDLRAATDRLLSRQPLDPADRAMIGVMIDGPRRVAIVVALSVCLLVGVAPLDVPPWWAVAALVVGSAALAVTHRVASDGVIRFGDRTRWSFATLGEVLAPVDHADLAPRRWVGTVGAVVVLNVAVGLRGVSDRWTHGLGDMAADDRAVAMIAAVVVALGGLYALRTIPPPRLANAHLVARRLEERSARRAALGAAVGLGLLGLAAGVVPVDDGGQGRPVEPAIELQIPGDVTDRGVTAGG